MPVRSAVTTYVGTFDGHGPEAWTDTEPRSFFKDPNILIPAAEVTRYKEDQDQWDIFRRGRKVIYTEIVAGVTYKYNLELVFYTQPAATTLTIINTIGRMIAEAGDLSDDDDTYSLVAGVSLGKYFSVGVDSFGEAAIGEYAVSSLATDAFVVAATAAGDGIWLIRSGTCIGDYDGACAIGLELTGSSTAGEFTNTGHATTEAATDDRLGVSLFGICHTAVVGAALGLIDLRLPERFPPLT
jgi:hypothetical protein